MKTPFDSDLRLQVAFNEQLEHLQRADQQSFLPLWRQFKADPRLKLSISLQWLLNSLRFLLSIFALEGRK